MSRDPMIVSGGNAIVFMSQLTLDFRKRSIVETDPITKDDGAKYCVTIKKNHCVPERNPYVKAEYFIIYGVGIEQYLETLDNALAQGVLIKNAAFIKDPLELGNPKSDPRKLEDGTKLQWQGNKNFREWCMTHQGYFNELRTRVAAGVTQMSEDEAAQAKAEEEEIASMVKENE
jgi:hypothetical protein